MRCAAADGRGDLRRPSAGSRDRERPIPRWRCHIFASVPAIRFGSARIRERMRPGGVPRAPRAARSNWCLARRRRSPPGSTPLLRDAGGDVVIAAGRGAGSDLEPYRRLADRYGGRFVVTRPQVEAGRATRMELVGASSETVTPAVYLGLGVSGSIAHVLGMADSDARDRRQPRPRRADFRARRSRCDRRRRRRGARAGGGVSAPVVVLGGGSTGEAFAGALAWLRARNRRSRWLSASWSAASARTLPACPPRRCCARPRCLRRPVWLPGAAEAITGRPDIDRIFWHRDQVTDSGDDSAQDKWLEDKDVTLVRGNARVVRPGVIGVGDQEIAYERLMIATGSVPFDPSDRRPRRRGLLDESRGDLQPHGARQPDRGRVGAGRVRVGPVLSSRLAATSRSSPQPTG